MHPRRVAHRESVAALRIVAAVGALANQIGLDTKGLEVSAKPADPAVDQMLRNEAAADLLEAMVELPTPTVEMQATAEEIVETTEALLLGRIEAIEGIGPKTMEMIRQGLAETSIDVRLLEDQTDAAVETSVDAEQAQASE